MFKSFDPNQTIKHVPYKVLKAQWKRERDLADKFIRVLSWTSVVGALILGVLFFVFS